jgi:hypothetical protein
VGFLIQLPLHLQLLAFALALLLAAVVTLVVFAWILTRLPMDWGFAVDLDAMYLLVLVPVAWVITSRIVLTRYDLTAPVTPFQVVLVGLIAVLTAVAVVTSDAPQWGPAHIPSDQRSFPWWFGLVISWLVLTEAFTAVVVLLAQLGWITFEPPLVGAEAIGQPRRMDAWSTVESILTWNLLDMIPSLKVPDTLNWQLTHHITDSLGGLLLLMYKILVVLPIVRFGIALLRPPTSAEQAALEAAEADRIARAERDELVQQMKAAGGTGPIDGDDARGD